MTEHFHFSFAFSLLKIVDDLDVGFETTIVNDSTILETLKPFSTEEQTGELGLFLLHWRRKYMIQALIIWPINKSILE
jgi:hypothetical protein